MIYTVFMTTTTQDLGQLNQNNTVLVPAVTLQELPHVTDAQRETLRAEFDRIEAEMKAGDFIAYSPEWLRGKLAKAFEAAPL